MAGESWSWSFFLNRADNSRFTLSCRQIMDGPPPRGISDARAGKRAAPQDCGRMLA
jgi:hypothetical protein